MTRGNPITQGTTLVVCDRSGVPFCELPRAQLDSVQWRLNDVGSASFTMSPLDELASQILLYKRELQVWYDGQVRWQGPLMDIQGDPEQMEVSAESLETYFQDRYVDDATLTYTNIDQLSIAWNLVNFAQTGTNRSFNIVSSGFGASGVNRLREYKRNDHANILDLLKEFPELNSGFDWAIIPLSDGQRQFTPYYPKRGTAKPNHALEWGKNIKTFRYVESTVDMANQVYATGGTNGDVKFEQNYMDAAAAAEYGVKQAFVSDATQKDVNWLLARATREVAQRKAPIVTPDLTLIRTVDLDLLFQVEVGDTVPVYIDHGRYQISGDYRITSITWNPDQTLSLVVDKAV